MPEQIPLLSAQAEHSIPFPEKRRIALVIGVDNAPNSQREPLHNAVADARDIAQALHTYCGFELFGGGPLLDSQAASHTVNDAVRKLVRDRTDDDFLLFYFSGHGLPMLLKNYREDVYLVTHDFQALDVEEDENRHISFKWLWERLYQGNNAGKVIIILDCCYAGNMAAHGQDLNMRDILHRLRTYFDNLNFEPEAKMDGLRQTLAATAYNRTTSDTDGRMTTLLVSALTGEASGAINAQNQVTLYSLCDYFDAENRPVNLSGNNANRQCILAFHRKAPQTHFPYEPDPLFQAREQELAELETLLCTVSSSPIRLGLTGIGGVGKSSLAKELTHRQQGYFTDGIFWLTLTPTQSATITREESNKDFISSLASLARKTRYLPLNEDIAYPNDEQRARYLCQFLARHPKTLLILDDLDDPYLLVTLLPELAGSSLSCAILYTSRTSLGPIGVKIYPITPLSHEPGLFSLLLQGARQGELQQLLEDNNNDETDAARSICQRTGGLPLAILLLRSQLLMDPWLTLKELDQEMEQLGVFAVADNDASIYRSLSATFDLSWQRLIDNDQTQALFKLASYFPGAASIPLWLLALATGMEEKYVPGNALGTARIALYRLGLIENIPDNKAEIQMHRIIREFGQHLVEQDISGHCLLEEAATRIVSAFEALPALVERAQSHGYWTCLHQLRIACAYVSVLDKSHVERLNKIEHRLARETFFLGASQLWPTQLPGLFYQQMYNRMLEDGQPLPLPSAHIPWLRHLEPVDIEENELLKVFASHKEEVLSVAFSPDGSKIVTGSADATACLFDVLTSKPLHVLSGHTSAIHSVAFSPDGLFVLTGSKDNTACLWNAENGMLITRLVGHTHQITVVAFAPNMTQILTGALDGTVRIWDNAGVEIILFPITSSLFTTIPHTPQLFDDESDDDDDEEPEDGPNPDAIACAAFSPDGSLILLGLVGGNIVLWNKTQNTRMIIHQERTGTVTSIAFSPDGSQFLTGSADKIARLWNTTSKQCLVTFIGHTAPILSAAFSPTDPFILTGSWDRTIRIWNKTSGHLLHTYSALVGGINSVTFSPSGTSILVGSTETIVRLLDFTKFLSVITSPDKNMESSSSLSSQPEEPARIHVELASMVFSLDGSQLLTVYANAVTYLWDVTSRGTKQQYTLQQNGRVLAATFSPDSTKIATGSLDRTARVWDVQSGKLLAECNGHAGPVRCVTFSPDSSHLLTGSDDATVRIWHIENGKATNRKTLSNHLSPVTTVAFSPDGQYILTGSEDSAARLWKHVGRNKYQYIPLPGHVHGVTAGTFSPDGTWLLTAASDTTLRLWEVSSGTLLHTAASHTGPIYLVAFSPNSKLVLTGDLFDQIRLWHINDDRSLHLLGAYATSCRIRALCWQDNHRILLADDRGASRDPHIYRLQLEGFG